MQIIPVLDILDGQVVRAIAGKRDQYLPIQTPLATGSEPAEVLSGLLSTAAFSTIYVADLNAIEKSGDNRIAIETLIAKYPQCTIWLDAGEQTLEYSKNNPIQAVIGTETRISPQALASLNTAATHYILSLDYKTGEILGHSSLLTQTELWPQDIILMNLDRIGSQLGPDVERLQEIRSMAPGKHYYLAGGIRHQQDLESLQTLGVHGALISSALHQQTIDIDFMKN